MFDESLLRKKRAGPNRLKIRIHENLSLSFPIGVLKSGVDFND